jgi:hypothetical protein
MSIYRTLLEAADKLASAESEIPGFGPVADGLIVQLRAAAEQIKQQANALLEDYFDFNPLVLDEVINQLRTNGIISAVREVRTHTACSIIDAKNYCEKLREGTMLTR